MSVLSGDVNRVRDVKFAVYAQLTHVTDRQTDGQTDRRKGDLSSGALTT